MKRIVRGDEVFYRFPRKEFYENYIVGVLTDESDKKYVEVKVVGLVDSFEKTVIKKGG
jgi:hypothetical protein